MNRAIVLLLVAACTAPATVVDPLSEEPAPKGPVGGQNPAPDPVDTSGVTPIDSTIAPPPIPPVAPNGEVAAAFGIWTPGRFDTCTQAQHDAFSVIGPDGKRYPTWHPPVDPVSGCTFGHEHGRDPSGSNLFATTGPIPFGYANEALHASGLAIHRHEDHVGHKIEWANNVEFTGSGTARSCDVMAKIHQGTHSKDAFTNNLHEVAYHLRCSDGAEVHFTSMSRIGNGGHFLEPCSSRSLLAGTATPPNSPGGIGHRSIPTRACIDKVITGGPRQWVNYGHGFTENWAIDPIAEMADGRRVAYLAMYFFVQMPARYYDPSRPEGLARSLDYCYEVEDPKDGRNMGECKAARTAGVREWDDPRSPFNGAQRTLRWNQPILTNTGGPTVIYTDAFGRNGKATPFPGSIRQYFSSMNNGGRNVTGPGVSGDYRAPGVHAPN